MSTGIESPQSVTVQYYYKGFSILLTKRDPEVEVKALLKSAMDSIDWALSQGLMPSWNKETNDQVVQQKSIPVEQFQETCEKCGSPKGTSKKGNQYCLAKCWLKQ